MAKIGVAIMRNRNEHIIAEACPNDTVEARTAYGSGRRAWEQFRW